MALFVIRIDCQSTHGCGEAMARGRIGVQGDEMEPLQVAGEVFRGDASAGAEEILQPFRQSKSYQCDLRIEPIQF